MGNRRRRAPWGATILVAVVALCASVAGAKTVAVDVFDEDGQLSVDVVSGRLIDAELQRALRSGLPARVELHTELWRGRAAFFDAFVLEHRARLRVVFDLLDERFDVVDDFDRVVLRDASVDEVEALIGSYHGLPLCDLDELDDDATYYVTVRLRVAPLSVEEVRDLEQWLRGGLRGEGSKVERMSAQLLGVLKGRIGLGDREHDGRSRRFRPGDLPLR